MKQTQTGRSAAAEELKIYFNTSGIYLKLLVCLVAILVVLIIGCDLYAGYTSEEEPNDLPETANEFQGTNISWTGKIENATDQDWYRVYLSAGNTYRFTLNNLQNDLNLMLYTSDINNIGNSDRNELLDEVIEYAVPTTSFYYVLVEGS
ncbi:MAG: pre-peptidase C-terminal domain-containing protein, partial [Sphaerochaetaceae bacterium]|nr:pre-peptidase C-terminal domain-containing protein [Sphaerochaetaceae bacterium]